ALVDEFGPVPSMTVERIGYGAGQKDFEHPNLLRILVGKSYLAASPEAANERQPRTESIVLLETNLDNATGEEIGHAVDQLWDAGALDVTLSAVQMKKGRPGVIVSVQAQPADADRMEAILFAHTPTLGVRRSVVTRSVLAREATKVETPWGTIAGKVAFLPDGSRRFSPEYEECHRIAIREGKSLSEVVAGAQAAFRSSNL
ncbi:MAG TPA: LarC family nickel insertion protein, partial [Lacipirellulaceae bacterium]|nr:LarC family nickel insertion protein [Lacipirellulaceae bacterium]